MQRLGLVAAVVATLSCAGETATGIAQRRAASTSLPAASRDDPNDSGTTARYPLPPGAYDLGQLPVLSKVLFYASENYFDKSRFNYRNMAMGALEFVQRDVPEVVVSRGAGRDGNTVNVSVGDAQRVFSLSRVDAFWSLRRTLRDIFGFVQANLSPAAPEAEGARLLDIEIAAVNGMLYTLDPHSVLLDPSTYAGMRGPVGSDRSAAIGLTLELDDTGRIVVVATAAGTPAESAGIAAGDRIASIDGDSTDHMNLDEVIDRLRGPVGSTVDLGVEHAGRRGSAKHTLARERLGAAAISPPARLLSGGIGYFRLRHLGYGASTEVDDTLRSFARQGASGIIMDLRGNSGGLYEEAKKVADEFVDQGTIVSMIGAGGSPRKDETATGTSPTPQLPLVVLVDRNTASGAEVIAAAMKHLDRGVVIGEPTFGMGTVQVLFEVPSPLDKGPDFLGTKLGLKLTTAQMLAAGGAPLQDWGLLPDIRATAVTVPAKGSSAMIHLQPSRTRRSERGFERSLPTVTSAGSDATALVLPYVEERGVARDGDRTSDPDTDPLAVLASGLLHQANGFERHELLTTADAFVAAWRAEQERRLSAALARWGIDWTNGPPGPPPRLKLELQRLDSRPGASAPLVRIRGVVTNVGATAAFRVRAVVESDHPALDEAELVFGRIEPGHSQTYDLSVDTPRTDAAEHAQTTLLHTTLLAQDQSSPQTADLLMDIPGAPQSTLSFRYQLREPANGDRVEIPVTITNTGTQALRHVRATLTNSHAAQRVSIPAGRFDLRELGVGASKTAVFAAVLPRKLRRDHRALLLEIQPDSGDPIRYPIRVDLSDGASNAPAGGTDPGWVEVDPPRLTLQAPAVASNDTVRVEGRASGGHGVHDVYIRVWNRHVAIPVRKVFYQLNSPPDSEQMAFQADVPLTRGANLIQVFARQSADATSMQTIVVLRNQLPR